MTGVVGMIADGDPGASLAIFYGHVQVYPRRLLLGVVVLYAEGVEYGCARNRFYAAYARTNRRTRVVR